MTRMIETPAELAGPRPAIAAGDVLAEHLARVPVHRALIRALEHQLFSQETLVAPVLDIGCGDGHFARAAFAAGIDVGIDVSREIVAEGKANGPYRSAQIASGTRLPFADGCFRTVVSNCVIEHVPDIESLVTEVARVLAAGGSFIFSVPNDRFTQMLFTVQTLNRVGLSGAAARYGRWWNRNAEHHNLESSEVWRDRLDRNGLTVGRLAEYMSPQATRLFELSHYYAIPSIVWHKLVGRWSLSPGRARKTLAFHRLLPLVQNDARRGVGSCTFYVATKR